MGKESELGLHQRKASPTLEPFTESDGLRPCSEGNVEQNELKQVLGKTVVNISIQNS